MRRIKLDQEIIGAFLGSAELESALTAQLKIWAVNERRMWEEVQKKFPHLNLTGAKINRESCELVMPFEEADDKETNKT